MAPAQKDFAKFFTATHGLDLSEIGEELIGDCPFCEKEGHFYVNRKLGLWNCKRCGSEGNHFSFGEKFHEYCLDQTTEEDYKYLCKLKAIPVKILKDYNVALSPITNKWLLPVRTEDNKLPNIYVFDDKSNKMFSSSGCGQTLYNLNNLSTDKKPIMVIEGHWDLMIMDYCLRVAGERSKYDLIAVPGANIYKKAWLDHLAGRKVFLLYDNDAAGYQGVSRLTNLCNEAKEQPESIEILIWPDTDECDEGFDLRDLYISLRKDHRQNPNKPYSWQFGEEDVPSDLQTPCHSLVKFIEQNTTSSEEFKETAYGTLDTAEEIEPIDVKTFDELCDYFKKEFHVHSGFRDAIAVLLATNLSVLADNPKNPVWIYLVGPPSSGKTSIAECIAADSDNCKSLTKLTGIFSGWKDPKSNKTDFSLIDMIRNKTVVIKDFTAILSMPLPIQKSLFGELRDCYDGASETYYRNNTGHAYHDIRFTMIACTTEMIRGVSMTELGERFMMLNILDEDYDMTKQLRKTSDATVSRILAGFKTKVEREAEERGEIDEKNKPFDSTLTKAATKGFIQHCRYKLLVDFKEKEQPKFLAKDKSFVEDLGTLIANSRAKVERDNYGDLLYEPVAEISGRLVGQMEKLGIYLQVVFNVNRVTPEIKRILYKLALATGAGLTAKLIAALEQREYGLTKDQIASSLGISNSSSDRIVNDLKELKIITFTKIPNSSGVGGRHSHLWTLTKTIKRLLKRIKKGLNSE